MLHVFLLVIGVVWGLSAIAVVTIFVVSERAFRRESAPTPVSEAPIVAARPRELTVSSVG